jgi:hypothetical protein
VRYPIRYLVSDEHRFVYLYVPKVACTSVKHALLPLLNFDVSDEELVREDDTSEIHKLINHSPHMMRKWRLLANLDDYRGYFKFAFVRNPWDRLVSLYLQKLAPGGRGMGRYEYEGVKLYAGMPFVEFVESVCAVPDKIADPHFRSQRVSVCAPSGEVLADFVGRFENLEEDFARVADALGSPHLALPHLTPAGTRNSRHYREFYDARLARLVGKRYHADANIFGYKF